MWAAPNNELVSNYDHPEAISEHSTGRILFVAGAVIQLPQNVQ